MTSRDGRARSASRRGGERAARAPRSVRRAVAGERAARAAEEASAQRERRGACDELWRASAQRERARSASRGAERAATSCGGRARSASRRGACDELWWTSAQRERRGACDELRAPRSLRREVNASPSVGHLSGSSAEHPYMYTSYVRTRVHVSTTDANHRINDLARHSAPARTEDPAGLV